MNNNENAQTMNVSQRRRWLAVIAAALVILSIGGSYWVLQASDEDNAIPFGTMLIADRNIVSVQHTRGEQREIIDLAPRVDDPAWSPDGTQIAYAKLVLGSQDIYVVNAAGTDERQLTHDTYGDSSPSWLPDGERIVFASDRDGDTDLYIMDADGANVQALTDNPLDDTEPDVSPDGTRIVFARDGDLYGMAIDGSDVQQLTSQEGFERMPAWSPDGTQIAYVQAADISDPSISSYLYIMNADGTQARQVTDWRSVFSPTWSPDGTQLAFVTYAYNVEGLPGGDVYTINVAGGELMRLFNSDLFDNGGEATAPDWSPDGTQIAISTPLKQLTLVDATFSIQTILRVDEGFVRDTQLSPDGSRLVFIQDYDVFTMSVDGQDRVQLTQTEARELHPGWSPDGTQIVFVSDADGDNELMVMNADGSDQQQLTTNDVDDDYPDWSPDGSQIIYRSAVENLGNLFLFDVANETTEQLTDSELDDSYPVWSPDGSQLLYTNDGDVWLMDPTDPSAAELIETGASGAIQNMSWSPDGTQYAFVYAPPGAEWGGSVLRLYVSDLEGEETLLANNGHFSSPTWLPDSTQFIYTNRREIRRRPAANPSVVSVDAAREKRGVVTDLSWSPDGTQVIMAVSHDLVMMNADGTDVRLLAGEASVNADGESYGPAWSPDGQRIVYSARINANEEIFVINADGTARQQLTTITDGRNSDPTWSPDGTQIAFITVQNGTWDVVIMDANGENMRQLTTDGGRKGGLAWSPDGSQMAFIKHAGGANNNGQVWVMNADGSDQRLLVPEIDAFYTSDDLSWSPDSKWLGISHGYPSVISMFRVDGDGQAKYRIRGEQSDWHK